MIATLLRVAGPEPSLPLRRLVAGVALGAACRAWRSC